MKNLISYFSTYLIFFICFCMLLVISGCVMEKPVSAPAPVIEQDGQLAEEIEELTAKLQKQKQLNARLQMSLLEKHVEVNKLMLKNEHLVRTFVRNKVKLRNRGTKVEAVRLLAEVTTVIDTARANDPGGNWDEVLDRAEQYLAEGKVEIDKGNLENFFSLVGKAFEQVQFIELENREDGQQVADTPENIFLVPLPMQLLQTGNVRRGPAIDSKVGFVLIAGTPVTAIGYKGMWVKVKINEQDSGWIHYSLLSGTEK
jgi:hypothetical protein